MRPRPLPRGAPRAAVSCPSRSEEHTSELQSLRHLVCRLLLEKKKAKQKTRTTAKDYSDLFASTHCANRLRRSGSRTRVATLDDPPDTEHIRTNMTDTRTQQIR